MLAAIEGQSHQPVAHHGEHEGDASKVKGRFGENGLTREERLGDLLGDADGPIVVPIGAVGEGDQGRRPSETTDFWVRECDRPVA